ncbi:uncharacterized protein LOC130789371 [Actinidia eriantha]|uniref:uncharacterized protein LOC130789371 n=1 Tax=Actinidia eriantha TaxID=165200 RepID=UPI00258D5B0B|nr:uncharacterized protein LOC130789371 [Actinidia eriantha]
MAKNRNKKTKKNGSTAMEITSDQTIADLHQAMDTSESAAPKPALGITSRLAKKGVQMKRSKNVRKMKAIAKAVSKTEKSVEKILKSESKTLRTQSAKKLYD